MSAVHLPKHTLSESPNSRTIEIYDWVITAHTNPISNAAECDALQATLQNMPLPEMTFGNNSLELEHKPSGWKYSFTTEDGLKGVKNGELAEGDGGVKVGYADAWLKSRYVFIHVVCSNLVLMRVVQVNPPNFLCRRLWRQSHMTGRTLRRILDMTLAPQTL